MFSKTTYLLLLAAIIVSCNQITMVDVYRENLQMEAKGKITEIIKYKGGAVVLSIRDSLGDEDDMAIGTQHFSLIRKWDYITKIANSNKCIIERNDSIIYIDCYQFESKYLDSLGRIEQWPDSIKNRWTVKTK